MGAQARRKRRVRATPPRGSLAGAALLLSGIAIGALATILLQGAGIRELVGQAKQPRAAQTAAPATAQPDARKTETDFTFFTVLPEIEVAAPPVEDARADENTDANTPTGRDANRGQSDQDSPTAERGQYILQAGSFSKRADADRLKATLALRGIGSAIQKVSIQGRGDFFRVRMGPYATYADLVKADQQVLEVGVKGLRLKMVKPG